MGADWQALAWIHVLVGFEADLLGLLPFGGAGDDDTEGLLITAFILYTIVTVIIALQKFASLKGPEKIINIVNCVLLAVAGILLIAGVAVAGDNANPYSGTLEVTAALMALLAAVFILLTLLGGGGKTTPS